MNWVFWIFQSFSLKCQFSFSRIFGSEGSIEKIVPRLEESNEQGMFTLENPNRYPKGQGPNPNPRGAQPRGIWIGIALGPRDEVWIFQGEHSLLIGYTFQFS